MDLLRCLLFISILSRHSSYGFLFKGFKQFSHYKNRYLHLLDDSNGSQNYNQVSNYQTNNIQEPKSSVPIRKDTCKLFLSGIIGTEPKESYLSNDHYVVNFGLCVTGHFDFVHDWEKMKVRVQ
jgi:hypothetical protein